MPRKLPPVSADPIDVAPLSDSLRALARRGTSRRLRKGVQIITEGDRGDTLYIVLSGALRAYSIGDDDREITYGAYGSGEYVGEMGLDGGLRSASVVTEQPTLCVVVTRLTLEQHLRDDPAFAFELLSKVIWRARAATRGLRQIALNNVYGRLKALLQGLAVPQAEPPGGWLIDPAPSHLELSRLLGCGREMVSRVLKELEHAGVVVVGTRRLVIKKPFPGKW